MINRRVRALIAAVVVPCATAQDWRLVDGLKQHDSPAAFDTLRARVVTVGSGRETREWNGVAWLHRPVPLMPKEPMCMAFDSQRGVTVALILVLGLPPLLQTWEYDGSVWVLRMAPSAPLLNITGSMVYDSSRARTVFVGASSTAFETWEWDGVNWQQRTSALAPPGRSGAALAFDAARARTVLFGGLTTGGGFGIALADTWEWDGTSWVQRMPPVSPSARSQARMAYDTARQVCVLCGGMQVADTWEYDGITWTQRSGPMPPPRTAAGLVYDRRRARTVMFGGRWGAPHQDLWEWDGTAWTQRFGAVEPTQRAATALAYSLARDRLVLFGGDLGGTGAAGETWEWDGSAWAQRTVRPSPPPRLSHCMWSDGHDVFVFGGSTPNGTVLNDTWRFDGTAWLPVATASAPPAREYAAAAFDPANSGALLFGGRPGVNSWMGDTWQLTASGWSQFTALPAPSARTASAIATDLVRQRVVLWGGVGPSGALDDTWEWDGARWLQQSPVHRPPAGGVQTMAYEPAAGVMVLLTKPFWLGQTLETWIWTATDWLRLDTPTLLSAASWSSASAAPGRVRVHDWEHLYELTPRPPLLRRYGAGCPSPATRLLADAWPRPGAIDFALSTTGHAPNAPVFFVVGTAAAAAPVGSCVLRVQLGGPIAPAVADALGNCVLPVPLPAQPALIGLRAFAQAWSLGPAGASASNGIDVTIGQ